MKKKWAIALVINGELHLEVIEGDEDWGAARMYVESFSEAILDDLDAEAKEQWAEYCHSLYAIKQFLADGDVQFALKEVV